MASLALQSWKPPTFGRARFLGARGGGGRDRITPLRPLLCPMHISAPEPPECFFGPSRLACSKLLKGLEARAGIDPAHKGFADLHQGADNVFALFVLFRFNPTASTFCRPWHADCTLDAGP